MSQQETLYEKIDLYLSGGLSEKDKFIFEQELALRPDWQQKIEAYRITNQMVLENYLLDIKGALGKVHEKNEGGRGKKIAMYTAGLLLVVGGVAFWYFTKETPARLPSSHKTIAQTHLPIKENKSLSVVKKKEKIVLKSSSHPKGAPSSTLSISIEKELPNGSTIQEPSPTVLQAESEIKVPNSIKNEPFADVKLSDPCAHVILEASIYTASTCEGEEKGSVVLSAFKGGKAPYKWSLKDIHHQTVATSGLAKGIYYAVISDAHNCLTTLHNIDIKEKHCEMAHHFNPFIGERWEVPVQTVSGKLTVQDKNGNVYFSTELSAGSQEYWSGESAQGELKTGVYLFTITHSDGSIERGTISIVR